MFAYVDYFHGKPHCNFSGDVGSYKVHFASFGTESHYVWFDSYRVLVDVAAHRAMVSRCDEQTQMEENLEETTSEFQRAVRTASWILFRSAGDDIVRVRRKWNACFYDMNMRN